MVTTAVLVATVGPATALTPYPPTHVVQLPLSGFAVDASGPIAGWYWMRSTTYSDTATYRFDTFNPSALGYDHKMSVFMAPLVTNTISGGAGWSARVHVTVTYVYTGGSKAWTYHVTLTNPFPLRSSLDSGGIGYQTYGTLKLNQSQFTHGAGSLRIQVTRDSTYTKYGFHPHVAVNTGAVSIWYLTP
jgi:hypothetical protein